MAEIKSRERKISWQKKNPGRGKFHDKKKILGEENFMAKKNLEEENFMKEKNPRTENFMAQKKF
jgi:hypothetical protein